MIDRKISVHLQDYPDVSYFNKEEKLVEDMDLVRLICSTALSIRDEKNLRVRLPLQKLTIIGKNSSRILPFKDIIAQEVNIKEVATQEDFSDIAELKLQINFKKIGAKYGSKVKNIIADSKQGKWSKDSDGNIEIAGVTLSKNEFEIKLEPKNIDEEKYACLALPTNDFLIELDIVASPDLINEGISRDIIRAIQQNRKSANLDVSKHINIKIYSKNAKLNEVFKSFSKYISAQVLASNIELAEGEPSQEEDAYSHKIDGQEFSLVIS